MPATLVTLDTRTVGDSFATIGIVRRKGRIIHKTRAVPYQFIEAALKYAQFWAEDHGYQIDQGEA